MPSTPIVRFLLAIVALTVLGPRAGACGDERPNIIWLVAEDMSPWVGCYGDDTVPTPNIDRLATEGVRYTNAFATSPVCAPARSALISGMYPTRIGSLHMRNGSRSSAATGRDPSEYDEIPLYEAVPPAFVRCFPELLRLAGYYCTNNSKEDYQFKIPPTVWDESSGKAQYRNRPDGSPFFAVFNCNWTHESKAFPNANRRPSVVSPEDVPLPPYYPDTPAVRDAMARSYDNIAALDGWVGQKLDELEHAGLLDSTIVFFYSDHGVGLPRGKRDPYDTGVRVPLIVRFPGGRRAGEIEDRVVSFVDFGPTVLSLAGIEPSPFLDGRPFLGEHIAPPRGFAFIHADRMDSVYDTQRAVTDGRFKYIRNLTPDRPLLGPVAYRERLPMTADLYALRESGPLAPAQWQLAARTRPSEELYDTLNDRWEVRNLVEDPEFADTLDALRRRLDGWMEDGDLGLVLPETRLVREHIWPPDGAQPTTESPEFTEKDGVFALRCKTEGASIGFRYSTEEPWRAFGPGVTLDASRPIEAIAHRIGFARSGSTKHVPAGSDR